MTSASFKENNGLFWNNSRGKYNVSGLSYDGNGNIKSLKRFDGEGSLKHDFTYHYSNPANRNALSQVTDKGVNSSLYRYDNLGNMLYDGRRDIHISYNILNLPDTISQGSDNISYIYTTGGEKLAQRIGSSYTYYRGVMIYAGNTLSYIKQPEGLIRKDGPYYTYNYFLKDHLGSTRVLLEAVEDSLRTVQTTDYYPFGLSFENNNLNRNKYLYTGKEFQDVSLGGRTLSMYDFGARFYDPEIGRWFNIDPALQLATPYGFCGNNPILNVDPDGRFFGITLSSMFIGAVTNILSQMGAGKITDLKSFLSARLIGSIAGGISSGVGKSVMKALQSVDALAGGFLNGILVGAAEGAVSGILSGAGNILINGGSVKDAFRQGVSESVKGMISGAIIGSITSGLAAKEYGHNFWTGQPKTMEFGVKENLKGFNEEEAKRNAKSYNKDVDKINRDMDYLSTRLNDDSFNPELTNQVTFKTTVNRKYGLTGKGYYYNFKTHSIVRGYTYKKGNKVFIHISTGVINSDHTQFIAVTGHELIHAYHYLNLGSINRYFTESVAYRFTFRTYLNANDFENVWETIRAAEAQGILNGLFYGDDAIWRIIFK